MWTIVPCWLPALVVMSVGSPRDPSYYRSLAMAVYLAVLRRADRSPALAWVLPPVQVLWVTRMHFSFSGRSFWGLTLLTVSRGRWGDRRQWWAAGNPALVVDSHLRCDAGRRPGLPGQPLRPARRPVSTRALAQGYVKCRY